jgi:crossover junction endodeoxyribonuclease RusA
MKITLKLPWPYRCTTNSMYLRGKVLSKDAKRYARDVCMIFSTTRGYEDARLKVCIYATPPDKRKRDLDNMLKVPIDSLMHAGWFNDDSQIDELSIRRMISNKDDPHLLVTIDDGDTGDNGSSEG